MGVLQKRGKMAILSRKVAMVQTEIWLDNA